MNQSTIVRIEELYPLLKTKAYQLIQLLLNKGIDVEVSQGLRTWPQQAALYAEGRTAPGKIITNARPEQSYHTFGLAFDIDIVASSGVLDWTGKSPAWLTAIDTGESLGLTAGAAFRTFPDRPHFQYSGRFPVTPDDEVLALFKGGGVAAVWEEVDKKGNHILNFRT